MSSSSIQSGAWFQSLRHYSPAVLDLQQAKLRMQRSKDFTVLTQYWLEMAALHNYTRSHCNQISIFYIWILLKTCIKIASLILNFMTSLFTEITNNFLNSFCCLKAILTIAKITLCVKDDFVFINSCLKLNVVKLNFVVVTFCYKQMKNHQPLRAAGRALRKTLGKKSNQTQLSWEVQNAMSVSFRLNTTWLIK